MRRGIGGIDEGGLTGAGSLVEEDVEGRDLELGLGVKWRGRLSRGRLSARMICVVKTVCA